MTIIEIKPLDNGSHRNQTVSGRITPPDGWAVIPASVPIPDTFPFVDVVMEDGAIVSLTPGVVPDPDPIPAVVEPTAQDDTDAMLVDHEYRLTMLELGITE